ENTSLNALSGAWNSCIFHCTVSVKLRKQIQSATIDDQDIFLNINTMSLATVDCALRRNTLRIKQVYRVPFVRTSDSQTVMLCLCASKSYTFPQLIASYQH